MKTRKILCLLLALCLFAAFSLPVFADGTGPKVIDEAGLLTQSQRLGLERRAQELADTYGMDVVILTNYSLSGKTSEEFADDYFDYNGYGIGESASGILLLVSMGQRDWAISTSGKAISAVTDYGNTLLQEAMLSDLSDGNYYEAFNSYLTELQYLFSQYAAGTPVDRHSGSNHRGKLTWGKAAVCVAVALVIAGAVTYGSAHSMNTATRQNQASAYLKKDSFQLTQSRDLFLYSTMSRTRRVENASSGGSSTHIGSSGRSHGGSHGKF